MAQLKDTIVSGNLRVTDTTLTDTLQVTTIKAPISSGGTTYGPGTSGQVLKSNGTTVYWGSDSNSVTGVKGNAESSYRTGNVNLTPANIGALALTGGTVSSSTFGTQITVERTGGANMAALGFKNTAGMLGYIAANEVDGDLFHYGADTNKKYTILDTNNLSTYVKASSNNGKLSVNGSDVTVYTHPTKTAQSTSNFYKITVDATGHVTTGDALSASNLPSHTHNSLYGVSSTSAVPVTTLADGQLKVFYNVSKDLTGNMPVSNNANAIIQINKHSGNYDSQLGFSSNGNIYYRSCNGTALSASVPWKRIYDTSNPPTASEVGALASTTKYAASSSVGGAATSANKLNTNAGATNRPVYFSGGIPVQCDTPWTSSWFKGVPLITTDGVMEIGKYIDFHKSNDSTADYDLRLQYTGTTTGKTITLPGASGNVALLAKGGTSYYGMMDGDGTTSGWIRTTTNGFIPATSVSLANGGDGSLGTSAWAFKNAYIANINGVAVGSSPKFTDENVLQSDTSSTSDFRPILLGTTHTTTVADLSATVTGQAYVSSNIFVKPNTGIICAEEFSTLSYINGTGTHLEQYGLYLKSYKAAALPAGGNYSYKGYVVRTYDGKSANNGGMLLTMDGGGLTIIGSGSASSLADLISDDQQDSNTSRTRLNIGGTLNTAYHGSSKYLILSSNKSIVFLTNCSTIADRKPVVLDTALRFYPGTTETGSIGISSYQWNTIYGKTIYENGTSLASKYAAIGHTHNYAGSLSAGGAANSADVLNKNTRMDYGWDGVNYFNINGTAGNAAKVNDTPTTAWWHIMRFNNYNTSGYYTDLAIPFGTTSLYYKRITAGSVQNGGWVKVLDSLNYTSYALPRNIKHIHTASGTEGTTGWVKIARITVTAAYADHPMTFTIAQRQTMQYRIHLVFGNTGSVATTTISQFIIARDNSWTDTNNNPRAYIIKPSDGIFDLYIRKIEGYDHIFVVDFTKADNSEGNNYSVAWTNVHAADSEITGGTEAVKKLYLSTSGGTVNGAITVSDTGTFRTNAFGTQLIVERTTAESMASVTFKNPSGILGHISANTVDGDLYHYGADTSKKYIILDTGNCSNYTFKVTRGSSVSTATTGYWAAMCNSTQTGSPVLPTSGKWWHVISMDWSGNDIKNWVSQLAIATQDGSGVWWRRNDTGGTTINSYSWHRLAEGNSSGAATHVATEVGDTAGARPVFYAYLGDNTRVVYNTNFTYNPSGNVLTATTFAGNTFKAGKANTTDGEIKFYRSGGSGETTLKATAQSTSGTYLLPACGNGSYTLSIGMTQVGGVGNSLVISNVSGIPTGTLSFKIIFKSDAASPIYSMIEIPNVGDDIDCGGIIQVGDYTDGQQGSLRIVMKGVVVRVTAGTTAGTKTFTATVSPTQKISGSSVSEFTRNVIMYKIYACC